MSQSRQFQKVASLFFSFLLFACPASAQSSSTKKINQRKMPEMLSYYQLTRLNERERIAYIEEVVELLKYVDARENGKTAELSASRMRTRTDLWSLLLRGESVNAVSCPSGQGSVTVAQQTHCVAYCPKGTHDLGGVRCSINFKNEKLTTCHRDCVKIGSAGWIAQSDSGIVDRNGEIHSWSTPKSGRVRIAVPNESTKDGEQVPVTLSEGTVDVSPTDKEKSTPNATDDTRNPAAAADEKKTLTPKDACYEIACPKDDPEYRFQVKEDFNNRVKETGDARCVNGGLIGKYDINGRKKCLPVQTLKIGPLDLKCKSGTTMCNPLLFGLEKSEPVTPYCIPIGLEMTKQCYDKASGADGAREFWKNPSVTHETMAEEWDKIVKFLREDICTEERTAKYHCLECAVIAKRLAELNKMVDGCPKANKCGDNVVCASRWQNVKGLEAGETNGGGGTGSDAQK